MICDFCTFPVVAWRFEATPFGLDYGHAIATSDSGWAACEECAELILAGDRGGLVERKLRAFLPAYPARPTTRCANSSGGRMICSSFTGLTFRPRASKRSCLAERGCGDLSFERSPK